MAAYEPAVDRTVLLEGPGHIILSNGTTYLWCDGPVNCNLVDTFRDIRAPGVGEVVESLRTDGMVEVEFLPSGNFPAIALTDFFGALGVLGSNRIPCSYYGTTDTAMTVHGIDGTKIALANAKLHTIPNLRMGSALPRWDGRAKAVGILKKNTARTTAGALYVRSTAQFTTVPAAADFARLPVQATWGAYNLATQDGWTVSWTLQLSPRSDPNVGTFDYRLTGLVVEARCRPLVIDDAIWATAYMVGTSARIGIGRTGADLTLAEDNPGLTVVLKNARLVAAPMAFGEDEPRAGELTWRAYRDLSAGYGALFTIALTAAA
jgi:hypothetical protein